MRRLILKMSISLDGFVADAAGGGDWQLRSRDATGAAWVAETLGRAGLHAMGRRTFEVMAGFWPKAEGPIATAMNAVPKAVFTRGPSAGMEATPTNGDPGWIGPRLLCGDLAEEIRALKSEAGGDVVAHGGADFAQNLTATGLIDEYQLIVHPIALGSGSALFARCAAPVPLMRVETIPFPAGAVAQVYRPATD